MTHEEDVDGDGGSDGDQGAAVGVEVQDAGAAPAFDLDAMVRQAKERLHRSIGQRARWAKAHMRRDIW